VKRGECHGPENVFMVHSYYYQGALLSSAGCSAHAHCLFCLAVYDLSDILPAGIHVIMPRTGSRRRDGIRLYTNHIEIDEITKREGLAITTPSRTIADVIVNGLGSDLVRQAVEEAMKRGMVTKAQLLEQADRRRGRVKKTIQDILETASQ